jgi:hypothetical protein
MGSTSEHRSATVLLANLFHSTRMDYPAHK